MMNQIVQFVLLLLQLLTFALIGRALLSWVDPMARWPVTRILADITEPIMAPIRRIVPPLGMIDISFIVALVLIQVLQTFLIRSFS